MGNGTLKRSITQKIKQYGGSGVVLSVIGQRVDNGGKGVGSTGKKGGISGRGDLVPVHLVESRTKPHAIRGRQNITLAYPVLAFAGDGGAVVIRRRVSRIRARAAAKFMDRAARSQTATAALRFREKLATEVTAEAAKL